MLTASLSSLCRSHSAARIISQSRAAAFSAIPSGGDPIATPATASTPTPTPSPPTETTESRRIRALSLYRQILRAADTMPTPNRQNYIKRKTRSEYRKHMTLTDIDEIVFQLRLADTNLDTVLVQAEHLSRSVCLLSFMYLAKAPCYLQ